MPGANKAENSEWQHIVVSEKKQKYLPLYNIDIYIYNESFMQMSISNQ